MRFGTMIVCQDLLLILLPGLTAVVLMPLLVVPVHAGSARATTRGGISSSSSWEMYDLYQILGLSPPPHPAHPSEGAAASTSRTAASGAAASSLRTRSKPKNKVKSRRRRRADRAKVTNVDVKRAYRHQALLNHPDKLRSSRRRSVESDSRSTAQSSSSDDSDSSARFARIAEAYEVLSNPELRSEYDAYLLDLEDEAVRGVRLTGGTRPNLFQNLTKDARCLFEDYFDGGGGMGGGLKEQHRGEEGGAFSGDDDYDFRDAGTVGAEYYLSHSNMNGEAAGGGTNDANNQPAKKKVSHPPPGTVLLSSTTVTESFYDAKFQADVLRVLRTETFGRDSTDGTADVDKAKATYTRTTGQDFIEFFRRCSERSLGHSAITKPFLVEGGPISDDGDDDEIGSNRGRNEKGTTTRLDPSTLHPHERLTSKSPPLVSPNGRYHAAVTSKCRLVVTASLSEHQLHGVGGEVWSTGKDGATSLRPPSECSLSLFGPMLLLGDISVGPKGVFRYTPQPIPVGRGGKRGRKDRDGGVWYARLDDDGQMAVYRRAGGADRTEGNTEGTSGEKASAENDDGVGLGEARKTDGSPSFWSSFRQGLEGFGFWTRHNAAERRSTRKGAGYYPFLDECVYATGKGGCKSPSRQKVASSSGRASVWSKVALGVTASILGPVLGSVVAGALGLFL